MAVNILQKKADTAIQFHFAKAGADQAFLVVSLLHETDALYAVSASYEMIAKALREKNMEIVHERIFGSLELEQLVKIERRRIFNDTGIPHDTPVTFIQGHPPWGKGLAGIIIRAVFSEKVWTIKDDTVNCGRGWQRNGSTFHILQNIHVPQNDSSLLNTRPLQTQRMLEIAHEILLKRGGSYRDVVRTWIYLSHINEWYREFNHARNYTYDKFGIMPSEGSKNMLPASTGIGAENPSGAPCTMDLMAVSGPQESRPVIRRLSNPEQSEAFHYYSAFSRGIWIHEPDITYMQVSGTAAIDERGKSLFIDDISGQITCTFDKIEALIGQVGAGLRDICAATVFVKHPEHAKVFRNMAVERGLINFPAVCVVADVCRDELLFEIDAEAVSNEGR